MAASGMATGKNYSSALKKLQQKQALGWGVHQT